MRFFPRVAWLALFVPLACVGCVDGGIKVGPFPVALAVGDGVLDPEELGVEPGKFGVHTVELPLCTLPTREQVDATVRESVDGGIASGFELTELLIDELVLTANEGSFVGVTSVSAFFMPPGSKSLVTAIPLGSSVSIKGDGNEIVLSPPNTVDVLDLIALSAGEECPSIAFVVSGITPADPIVWQGDLFTEAYGVLDLGL